MLDPADPDYLLSLVQSGTALMRECGAHRDRVRMAIRTIEQGQPLSRHENIDLLEGVASLCTRLQGDTHLRMFATERLADQFAARLVAAAEPAPPLAKPSTWLGRVLLALFS